MFLRALAVAGVAVALVAGSASAAGIHGRGPRAEAGIDSMLLFVDGSQRVQVLTELCTNPVRITHCSAIPRVLRRAIEHVVDRPITWVNERSVRGPVFWVFAPVAFDRARASASFAWWDPGAFACRGGSELRFTRTHGGWSATEGTAWEGCSAT
ncbi:MAG: hypothetical protein ABJB55_08335 [Actinomycetota bacterium]